MTSKSGLNTKARYLEAFVSLVNQHTRRFYAHGVCVQNRASCHPNPALPLKGKEITGKEMVVEKEECASEF